MHVVIAILMLFITWKYGDWRHWKKYHTVMLYFAVCDLLYNFLTAKHFLWRLLPDLFSNYTLTELIYVMIVFPATALLFICNYPNKRSAIIIHYVKWVGSYTFVEWIYIKTNHIGYQYGWHLGWSFLFDCIMFPMLYLFHKKPLVAYLLSIPIALFFIWMFHVPVNTPLEQR